MAREIKFRAWDKELSVMIHDGLEYEMRALECIKYGEDAAIAERPVIGFTKVETDEFEIMQFTGLKDKNRIDIYEGDIVAAKHRSKETIHIGSIQMPKSCWVLQLTNDLGNLRWYRTAEFSELEVIGNTHQHPELL